MKYLFSLFTLIIVFSACKSTTGISKKNSSNTLADKIINNALQHLGAPYKMAGKTSSGYDCSGLVYSTFGEFDIPLPRTSIDQSKTGKIIGSNTNKAEKGDLIFFKTNNSSRINHVGLVTESNDDEVKFIHSSTSKGVIISSTKESYYEKSFSQINRILE